MANFNKVILAGNLTRDPQLRYLPSQTAVVDFGLAVNHKWRTPQGEDREEVLFIDCTCFGKQAETINKYCQKGKPILIEGRLKYETWDDKESGGKRSKHKVIIDGFQFLGGRDGAPGGGGGGAGDRAAPVLVSAPCGLVGLRCGRPCPGLVGPAGRLGAASADPGPESCPARVGRR